MKSENRKSDGPDIDAHDVLRYLKKNPSFFEENSELLAELELDGSPDAVRFYERQLQVLREREDKHKAKIEMIVDSARSNQQLESGLFDLAVLLLGEGLNANDPVSVACDMIRQQFDIANLCLMLEGRPDDMGEFYEDVKQRVAHGGSVCDDRVPSRLLAGIFGEQGGEIGSCAFVPVVHRDNSIGVMVLGSDDEEQFQPGIGVMYLDRLGLLLGGFISGNRQ